MLIGDRFQIDDRERDLIGRGGMGDVYRGTDLQTGQAVAIKALRPEVVSSDPDALARFLREGEALRQLNHPNIVQMVAASQEADGIEAPGRHYLVMEYVWGGSLRDLLDHEGQLSVERTLEIALEVADALTRAHHLGILHRDLKPSNVLLAEDGTPRLTDFGCAHLAASPRLTQTGTVLGTVLYLSPEACRGEELDARADIWAFGVMLYEMLVGEPPFAGGTFPAVFAAILSQPVPDLAQGRPDVPDALAGLVYRMLEKDRAARIPRVRLVGAELEDILEAIRHPSSDASRPKGSASEGSRLKPKKHVFLSYCHANREQVDRLHQDLEAAGEQVWWDQDILPGADWRMTIQQAVEDAYAIIFCFSTETDARPESDMFPELHNAIDAYRSYSPGSIFLIPVRLSFSRLPDIRIDAVRDLSSLQYVDLFPEPQRAEGLKRLVRALRKAPHYPQRKDDPGGKS
jgi:serine/threonine protein kinase